MANIRGPELLIILVMVLLLFGVGRVGKIGSELGQAVGNFRKGLREGAQQDDETKAEDAEAEVKR